MQAKVASGVGYGAIGGAVSALTANDIAKAVTNGQGVTDPAQLALITAGTTLLSGTIAAALGQNAAGAVNAAANETLNNNCAHACGENKKDTESVTVSPLSHGASGVHDDGNTGGSSGVETITETVGAGPLVSALAGASRGASTNGTVVATYGPMNPGPLSPDVTNTFRSGTYTEMVTQQPTTLYRVYGGTANQMGGYWTLTPPAGPVQSIIDSALLPQWGNPATNVVTIEIPTGTTYYTGAAAPQGGLVGGGNQVMFPPGFRVNPAWIKKP